MPMAEGMDDGVNQGQGAQAGGDEGWMDLDDYQREQSIDGGDIGDGGVTARNGEDSDLEDEREEHRPKDGDDEDEAAPVVKAPKPKSNGVAKSPAAKPLDKAARAQAKKQRRKEEKRQMELERQKKNSTAT